MAGLDSVLKKDKKVYVWLRGAILDFFGLFSFIANFENIYAWFVVFNCD
jgi:hypothetical protein